MFKIEQSDWTGGGHLIGTFAGEDLTKDGVIDLADGEVSGYHVEFSGDAIIPNFSHDLPDLEFFRYTLGSSGFGPSFPLFSIDLFFFYDADDHVIGRRDRAFFTTTGQDARVSRVPDHSAGPIWNLLGLPLLLIGCGKCARNLLRIPATEPKAMP